MRTPLRHPLAMIAVLTVMFPLASISMTSLLAEQAAMAGAVAAARLVVPRISGSSRRRPLVDDHPGAGSSRGSILS